MTETHSQRAHARLAPSASHRWMECPGSVQLSEGIEQTTSVYADEGTAAHELAAHCLNTGFDAERFADHLVDIKAKRQGDKFLPPGTEPGDDAVVFTVDDDMVEGVQMYIDYVRNLKQDDADEMDVEFRFDLQHIDDGMFGTGDFVLYRPSESHLIVADLKYGRGVPVDPESNPQLLCYGIGAVRRHGNRSLKKVTLAVIQPRCKHPKGPIREWHTDPIELLEFEVDIKDAALKTQAPDAPLNAGEWCKFCPAAGICPALREFSLAAARAEFSEDGMTTSQPEFMSADEMAEALEKASVIESWLHRLREVAHDRATKGEVPTGWKLVQKRATRKWKDENSIADTLMNVYEIDRSNVYIEKLVSPAQVEKFVPGKNKEVRAKVLEPFVVKNSSGTVLAPDHDARPAVKSSVSEFTE